MSTLRNRQYESKVTFTRLLFIILFFVFIFSILIARVYQLQVSQYDKFLNLSHKNKTKNITLMPYRGDITDRYGHGIAYYQTKYFMRIDQAVDSNQLPPDVSSAINKLKVPLEQPTKKTQIQPEAYAYLNNHPIPGVTISEQVIRYYPYPESFAHILGYTAVSKNNQHLKYPNPNLNFMDGKTGCEQTFNQYLIGQEGLQSHLIDARWSLALKYGRTSLFEQPIIVNLSAIFIAFWYFLSFSNSEFSSIIPPHTDMP